MKISITEFRDMVAEAVRRTVREAKRKPKEIAPRSEESILAQRDAMVRGLPGYAHGNVLDMAKPLGKRNKVKKQGASGMGNWTSEGRRMHESDPDNPGGRIGKDDYTGNDGTETKIRQGGLGRGPSKLSSMIDVMVSNGIPKEKAMSVAKQLISKMNHGMVDDPKSHGMGDPSELGIESRNEAVRRLVRMVVREEIRVRR